MRGRFGARDPLVYWDGPNLYIYADGSPVSLVDPFGLSWYGELVADALAAFQDPLAVGGAFGYGALEGCTKFSDHMTFGCVDFVHEEAEGQRADARERGDVLSQVGDGSMQVGAELTQTIVGGAIASKTKLGSQLLRGVARVASTPAGRGAQVALGTAAAISQGKSCRTALRKGDWAGATAHGGRAAIAGIVAADAAANLIKSAIPSSPPAAESLDPTRKPAPPKKPIDSSRPQHGSPEHDAAAFNKAKAWEGDPATVDTRFNQDLVDAQRNRVPEFRPDAQRIRQTSTGEVVDVAEIRSPGQSAASMDAKAEAIRRALGSQAGHVSWSNSADTARH